MAALKDGLPPTRCCVRHDAADYQDCPGYHQNNQPHRDCFVLNRFRWRRRRLHCGSRFRCRSGRRLGLEHSGGPRREGSRRLRRRRRRSSGLRGRPNRRLGRGRSSGFRRSRSSGPRCGRCVGAHPYAGSAAHGSSTFSASLRTPEKVWDPS